MSKINLLEDVPYYVNNAFGDPFTNMQIESTINKAKDLISANQYFTICTKAHLDDRAKEKILELTKLDTSRMFLGYSLTGLDEGGISWNERVETIEFLYSTFGKLLILARPMIAGRNMTKFHAERIIEVASETSKMVSFAGKHDSLKRKIQDDKFLDEVENICEEYGVKNYRKTSCATSDWYKIPCLFHSEYRPQNLDVLKMIGYEFVINDNIVCLNYATTGDLNFVHLLTKAKVVCKTHVNNSNALSFSSPNSDCLECTSSGLSWSDNVPCDINCDYCIIREIPYLDENKTIGESPLALSNAIRNRELIFDKDKMESTISDQTETTSYQDVRRTQKCNAERIVNVNAPYRQAVGCIIHLGGSYLLVHKISTTDVRDSDFQPSWDLLKGGIQAGESKEEALFREVEEELGLNPESVRRTHFLDQTIDFDFPPGSNFKGQVTSMALVELEAGSEAKIEIDQAELGAFKLCSFAEMVDLVAFPETREFLVRNQAEIQTYLENEQKEEGEVGP